MEDYVVSCSFWLDAIVLVQVRKRALRKYYEMLV